MDRKHYGKMKNCSLQAISPFSSVFSKNLNCRHVKTRACLGKDSEYNYLRNDKILDETKLKAFADDKTNVAQMMIPVFDRVENIVEKGENAGCQHFLLFSTMFSEGSLPRGR